MSDSAEALEKALEKAVSRALRDNLAPLQRTADEVLQAYADLVAACGSSRPSNALPALIRAQTAAASLSAGLSVLSAFVTAALNDRDRPKRPEREHAGIASARTQTLAVDSAVAVLEPPAAPVSLPEVAEVAEVDAAPVHEADAHAEVAAAEPSPESETGTWAEPDLELEPDQPFVHDIDPRAEIEAASPGSSVFDSEVQAAAPSPVQTSGTPLIVPQEPDVQAHWDEDVPLVSLDPATEMFEPLVPPVGAQSRASLFDSPHARKNQPLGLAAHHVDLAEKLAAEAPEKLVKDHFLGRQPEAELGAPELAAVQESPVEDASVVGSPSSPSFDVSSLPAEIQELHRRANRVAKVAMQDIKLLRPKDVRLGRENKDICVRLRSDIDKARKEYDRRFHAILDQPVDYFHRWMVEILAEGDSETLGEYPYPSPVLRH